MKFRSIKLMTLILLLYCPIFMAQQIPDTAFTFNIKQPAYSQGEGSLVLIDQAHSNFHTVETGFSPFAKLLRRDGYQVSGLSELIINPDLLGKCKILVIANALDSSNSQNWILPTPSAFSKDEIKVIKNWVERGGSLLLIADHMPFAGAAYGLGKAFGFEFLNGFAYTSEQAWPPSVFSQKDKTLIESHITNGNNKNEKIDSVATFTGSAFKTPADVIPVLSFLDKNYSLQPDTAWRFNKDTRSLKLTGYYQGAVLKFGKGKVAIFGEAAMFTAQIVNENFKVGFNSADAPQNAQFTLNLIHWLDGVKEYSGTISKD